VSNIFRNLDPTEREGFTAQWQVVQSRFVDFPKGAVTEADELVSSLMPMTTSSY
jgi:hypothetical protein